MANLEMEIKKLSFTYPSADNSTEEKTSTQRVLTKDTLPKNALTNKTLTKQALSQVDLSIEEGSFIVLCGPSGSGKTTLLRHLKKEISPLGQKSGSVFYQGQDLESLDSLRSISEIGMVFQDPENQIVLETVIQELAFSLENQGLDSEIIKKRTAEIVSFFGLEDYLDKLIHELSGGQKQIVNLCSVLMLRPQVLLLDEPTSQLDPIGAKKFLKMLFDLNQEFSLTVILSEHRLEEVFPLADKIVYLEEGRIIHEGSPKEFCKDIMEDNNTDATDATDATEALEFIPSLAQMYYNFQNAKNNNQIQAEQIPLTVRQAKEFLKTHLENSEAPNLSELANTPSEDKLRVNELGLAQSGRNKLRLDKLRMDKLSRDTNLEKGLKQENKKNVLLKCQDLYFKYDIKSPLVLKDLSLNIEQGEFLAILGGNGSGKSTLLKTLAGLLAPQKGNLYLKNKKFKKIADKEIHEQIGFLAQNPLLHFTADTVAEELDRNSNASLDSSLLEQLISLFELDDLLNRHPYDLSGGQQQKLAIACVLLTKPVILLLDEPTKGLDPVSKINLIEILNQLQAQGLTIIMSTHDLEFAAKYASKCALLFAGEIAHTSSPEEFFSSNYYYTTSINRALRDYQPQALTEKDVAKWL